MTDAVRPKVRLFFERFDQASDALDLDVLAGCFDEVFLNLDPTSAGPVTRDALLAALPMRGRLFATIGAIGTELSTVDETRLDDLHTLVKTTWNVRFSAETKTPEPLVLSSTFLLRLVEGEWRTVVYLNHNDVVALIRTRAAAQPR